MMAVHTQQELSLAEGNAARRSPYARVGLRRSGGAAWCAVGSLAFCFLTDSSLGSLIPLRGPLRMGVPVLLTLVMLSARAPRRSLSEQRVARASGAFALAGIASSLFSVAPELGLLKLTLYLGVMVPLLLCRPLIEGLLPGSTAFHQLRLGFLVVLTSAFAQARLGVPGFFTNPNAIAGFCVLSLPFIVFGFSDISANRRKWSYGFLAIALLTVMGSGSRGGAAALLAGLLTYYGLRKGGSWQKVLGIGVLVAALGGALLVANEITRDFAFKEGDTLLDEARVSMFEEGAEAFAARPLLGYGFGLSWRVRRDHVADALRTGRLSWFVGEFGNSTIATLAGGGLLLLGCLIAIMSGVLTPAYQSLKRLQGEQNSFQLSLIAGIVALLVQSQAEAWLMAPLAWTTIAFWIYAALALRCANLPTTAPPAVRPSEPYPGGAILGT